MLIRLICAAGFAILASIVGCSNPPIVPLANETYMLSKEDHAGIFGSMSKLKAEVISEANSFAASKGMVAVPVSFRDKPVGNRPADWAAVEYQFKLVPPDSPEANKASLNAGRQTMPIRPDISVQGVHSVSTDVSVKSDSPSSSSGTQKDLYAELLKLEDLRKRGILTDAEFETEKKKLLSTK